MAEGFPYYFKLSNLDSGILTDLWIESATGAQGNFLGNSSSNNTSRVVNVNSDYWTMIWTQDHLRSVNNSGSVSVIAGNNWCFGIDASNFPFVANANEAYTFEDITLGQRNCLALSKNGSAFTLTSFNVPAQQIEAQQSKFFNPNFTSTTGVRFAGGGFQPYQSKYFYGTVDQLSMFNQVLTNDSLLTLFSGYLHQNIIYTPPQILNVLQNVNWQGTGGMTTAQISVISGAANYFTEDAFLTPRTGNFYGKIELGNSVSGYNSTNYLDESQIFNYICPTDNAEQFGPQRFVGAATGLPSFIGIDAFINYRTDGTFFSFDASRYIPGLSLELDYRYVEYTNVGVVQNTGYYNNFWMYGIVAEDANTVALATFPSGFGKINRIGTYDVVQELFKAPGVLLNDKVYLDGLAYSGYSLSGDYIDIVGFVETGENKLIYDQVSKSGIMLQMFNLYNYATGQFHPKTAATFTGDQSFDYYYRIAPPDFVETHPYHLYHGRAVNTATGTPIYQNYNTHFVP